MIDWKRVKELRDEVGEDGFGEIVELFLEEVEEVVHALDNSPGRARLQEQMHFLKGGAWNLGFAEFGAICADGERKCAAGLAGEVDLSQIAASYQASKAHFTEETGRRQGAAAG